jgi:hypothetical protein
VKGPGLSSQIKQQKFEKHSKKLRDHLSPVSSLIPRHELLIESKLPMTGD